MKCWAWMVYLVVVLSLSVFCFGGCDDDDDNDNSAADDDDDATGADIELVWGGAPGHTGTEIVVTSDGRIHLAAIKGRALILYSGLPGGPLTQTEIAPFADGHTLAADRAGNLHLAYKDLTTGDLVYRTNAGKAWSKQIVVAGNQDHEWDQASLALDAQDKPHLAFYDSYLNTDAGTSVAGVRYAVPSGDTWEVQKLDDTDTHIGWKDLSLAVDAQGYAHLAYVNGKAEEFRYATNTGGSWETTTIDQGEDVGDFCSLAVDGDGRVHIAYNNDSDGGNDGLYYATDKSGQWRKKRLGDDESGSFRSLGVDADGHVFIACTLSYGEVGLWTDRSGAWLRETVSMDVELEPLFASLFIDADGAPHLAYYDDARGWLKYAAAAAEVWTVETIDDAGQVRTPPSLALNPDGSPAIAYIYGWTPAAEGALMLADRGAETWSNQIVDSALSSLWEYTALAIDPAGDAHLVYSKITAEQSLFYATNPTGDWAFENPDPQAQFPEMVAIDRDNAGAIHLVYADDGAARLRYASNATGSWVAGNISALEMYSEVGVALQVDPQGVAHVAWADDGTEAVYYADNASGDWTKKMIQNDLWDVQSLSLQLDDAGAVHLAFVSYYATNASGDWLVEELDTALLAPAAISLALDNAGHAHVAFDCFGLCYASNVSGQWEARSIDSFDGDYYISRMVGDFPSLALDDKGIAHVAYLGESGLWYATFPADGQ